MADTEPDSQTTPPEPQRRRHRHRGARRRLQAGTRAPGHARTHRHDRRRDARVAAQLDRQRHRPVPRRDRRVRRRWSSSGLSSRDAVAMASDIEDLTGVTLTATVAFRHPTIESLATVIVEGEPEVDDAADDFDWSRDRRASTTSRSSGLATRFPGDMNTPDETWQALLEGRDGDHRSARGPLGGVPRRAAASPSGSPRPAPAAATSPTSRVSTPSSSRCRRWRPTTSTRSSGWRWS